MTLKNKRKKAETWLIKNKRFINYSGIERKINAPKGMVQQFAKYGKPISDKYIESLYDLINNMTKFTIK